MLVKYLKEDSVAARLLFFDKVFVIILGDGGTKRDHYSTDTNLGGVQNFSILYNLVQCRSEKVKPLNVCQTGFAVTFACAKPC